MHVCIKHVWASCRARRLSEDAQCLEGEAEEAAAALWLKRYDQAGERGVTGHRNRKPLRVTADRDVSATEDQMMRAHKRAQIQRLTDRPGWPD